MTLADKQPAPMAAQDLREMVQAVMQDPLFADRNLEYASRREFIYGRRPVRVPGLEQMQAEYHWPRLRKHGNAFKNRLLNAPATFNIAAQSDKPNALKSAQKMKNFASRQYDRWRAQGCFDGAIFDMVTMGRGQLHPFINRDVLPIIPEPGIGQTPDDYKKNAKAILDEFSKGQRTDLIGLESVLSETVYWLPDMSVKFMAAELPVSPLAKAYKGLDDDRGAAVTTLLGGIATDSGMSVYNKTITLYVVEDADYIYHLIFTRNQLEVDTGKTHVDDGHLLGTFTNPFGAPAFIAVEAERTGDPRPLYSALPLIDGLYDVGPLVNIMGTLIVAGGVQATQNQETLENLPGAEAAADRAEADPNDLEINQLQNGIRIAPEGKRIVPSGYKLPADVSNAYAAMLKEAEEYGYPVALGQPQDMQTKSGYDRALIQEPVSAALDPPLEHIGDAINALTLLSFEAYKSFAIPATIRNLQPSTDLGRLDQSVEEEITLQPDDIVDVDTAVTFSSITKATQIADQEEGMKMLGLGLMFKDEFLTDHRGVQDIERYYDRETISKMRDIAQKAIAVDAAAVFQSLRQWAAQKATEAAKLKGPMGAEANAALATMPPADGAPPTDPSATMPADVTASNPTGPGTASALVPPTPTNAPVLP